MNKGKGISENKIVMYVDWDSTSYKKTSRNSHKKCAQKNRERPKEQVHEKKDDVFLYMKILVELDCHASVATHASIVQETKKPFWKLFY
jgi:hypothetical protein